LLRSDLDVPISRRTFTSAISERDGNSKFNKVRENKFEVFETPDSRRSMTSPSLIPTAPSPSDIVMEQVCPLKTSLGSSQLVGKFQDLGWGWSLKITVFLTNY
jgi:hypothetical protein